ncbi:MAG: response regulator transcription factor [Candidatus Delongbacteria bacterium]|jgi:DNA-binding NarL/FixJ family response regulator|nr:response regulator transcription factor [Candidatus Delongbacteria bacterium]
MNSDNKIKVMLVDDHTLFRNGLKTLLEESKHIKVVSEAVNGKDFLTKIRSQKPDVVLLDIAMPVMDGVEAASQALSLYPDLKIITLSMYGDENYYNRMVEAGAKGFILKDSEIDEVEKAIITVNAGRTYFSQELLQSLLEGLKKEDSVEKNALSEREVDVLQHVCRGKSNIEIADEMCLSKRTVEKHRANIMEKTHCKNTASLVIFAVKNHLYEVK